MNFIKSFLLALILSISGEISSFAEDLQEADTSHSQFMNHQGNIEQSSSQLENEKSKITNLPENSKLLKTFSYQQFLNDITATSIIKKGTAVFTIGLLVAGGIYFYITQYPDLNDTQYLFSYHPYLSHTIGNCDLPDGFLPCAGYETVFHNSGNNTNSHYQISYPTSVRCDANDQKLYQYYNYSGNVEIWLEHIRFLCSCNLNFLTKELTAAANDKQVESFFDHCDLNEETKTGCCLFANQPGSWDRALSWGCSGDLCLKVVKWVPDYVKKLVLSNFYESLNSYVAIATPVALIASYWLF